MRGIFYFMGFLASGQTVEQQQQNQANFQLGMNIGVEQIRQQQAATNALKQVQMANEAEAQRQLAVRQSINEERAYEANLRLEGVKTKSAADFTRYIAKIGIDNVTRSGDTLLRSFEQFTKHPEIYDESTISGYNKAQLQIGSILGKAQGAIGMLKPGDGFDITPYTEGLNSIPVPPTKFSQAYTDYLESKTYKNNATGDKLEKGSSAGASKSLSGYVGAIGEYQTAKNTLSSSMLHMDQAKIDESRKKGVNPFGPEQTALDAARNNAAKFGNQLGMELSTAQGDAGVIYRNLKKKGINPLDPEQADRIGSELYTLYDRVAKTDADKESIARYAPIFTGKPIDAYKPFSGVTPGGWGAPSLYMAPGASTSTASNPSPMGMTPPPAPEDNSEEDTE